MAKNKKIFRVGTPNTRLLSILHDLKSELYDRQWDEQLIQHLSLDEISIIKEIEDLLPMNTFISIDYEIKENDEEAIIKDIAQQQGHIFLKERQMVAYAAIVSGEDPYYENIDGQWLTNGNYITVHRIAIHNNFLHRGYADHIIHYAEKNAKTQGIPSFRIDTHHDNLFMRNLVRNNGFTYCGIVQVRDGERLAYEKKLS